MDVSKRELNQVHAEAAKYKQQHAQLQQTLSEVNEQLNDCLTTAGASPLPNSHRSGEKTSQPESISINAR
jgi:methionine aminopeptidase